MWDLVFRIVSAAVKDDGVEGAVELAVAAAAEPVAGGLFRSRPGSGRRQSLRGWESPHREPDGPERRRRRAGGPAVTSTRAGAVRFHLARHHLPPRCRGHCLGDRHPSGHERVPANVAVRAHGHRRRDRRHPGGAPTAPARLVASPMTGGVKSAACHSVLTSGRKGAPSGWRFHPLPRTDRPRPCELPRSTSVDDIDPTPGIRETVPDKSRTLTEEARL
jgi:hypothetical protein